MNALLWHLVTGAGKLMKNLHVTARQIVQLDRFSAERERILDLGGGGEGVIGQLCGSRVTAIDLRQEELDEAPSGPTKIVADARDLPFGDSSFDVATAFYFLMYVPTEDRDTVLQEAHRVLRPGGKLIIWDTVIAPPPSAAAAAKTFAVPVCAALPTRTIRTLYGVRWEHHEMSAHSLTKTAQRVGFMSKTSEQVGEALYLTFAKES